jgi:hypothetical protein
LLFVVVSLVVSAVLKIFANGLQIGDVAVLEH